MPKIGYLVDRTWDDDPEESWSFYAENNVSRYDLAQNKYKRIVYWEVPEDES